MILTAILALAMFQVCKTQKDSDMALNSLMGLLAVNEMATPATQPVVIAHSELAITMGDDPADRSLALRDPVELENQSYDVTADVPAFMTFKLAPTSDFKFDVTSLDWIEAKGSLSLQIVYNDLVDTDAKRFYVRAYMKDADGLVGSVVTENVIPLEMKGGDVTGYGTLDKTEKDYREWKPPYVYAIKETLTFKLRGDFSRALAQKYAGTVVFEFMKDIPVRTSCKSILDSGASTGNGIYSIDPDGNGSGAPFDVYCDMTTDGGGWTRIDYATDLSFTQHFSGNDAWRWLPDNFSTVLNKEQISAIQSVSSAGRQRYVGQCRGVIHYYYSRTNIYTHTFGFRFLNSEETGYGKQDIGLDFTMEKDDCGANDGINRETIFLIRDKRVPITNVFSADNGDSGEFFGSPLTKNPAWLR